MMLIADALNAIFDLMRIDFSILCRNGKQLASRKMFRCGRFVHVYVCKLGTDDRMKGSCHRRQRRHVRTCAVVDKEGFDVSSEKRPEPCGGAVSVFIRSIGRCVTGIRER